jgi:8-oxo-dGTP diphosphatase
VTGLCLTVAKGMTRFNLVPVPRLLKRCLRHDHAVVEWHDYALWADVPRIPASAGALIRDEDGRLLILKPTYKKNWTIPGGQIEPHDESPWEACRRETFEECGLRVEYGRLACVDFLRVNRTRPGGVRFLFDCGAFDATQLRAIVLDGSEIEAHRFVDLPEALELLSGPLRRRVSAVAGETQCLYLEEGRPVPGVEH